jgi:hypothetical protein
MKTRKIDKKCLSIIHAFRRAARVIDNRDYAEGICLALSYGNERDTFEFIMQPRRDIAGAYWMGIEYVKQYGLPSTDEMKAFKDRYGY